jgi:hypothetical protein
LSGSNRRKVCFDTGSLVCMQVSKGVSTPTQNPAVVTNLHSLFNVFVHYLAFQKIISDYVVLAYKVNDKFA